MIIKRERFRHSILAALADREMVGILDCCMFYEKSVSDIIREKSIPHTTAYRKINWMLEEGLLTIARIQLTSEGKKFSLFRSTLKTIAVRYEHGQEVVVEAEENVNAWEKTTEKFFSLKALD